jgi:hypothetical protein
MGLSDLVGIHYVLSGRNTILSVCRIKRTELCLTVCSVPKIGLPGLNYFVS